jgi:pimeloyl-ACP methyl ester carboxylesterase
MPQTDLSGVRIDYDDLGQGGPALLLMTAWCMSRSVYGEMPAMCAKHRRTLALDWRGHGHSEKPAVDYGAADLVEDALAVIEASGAERIVPVTMSHSGWIGLELRKRLGERIPRIVHTDWLVIPPPPPYMDLVNGLASEQGWQQARDILFGIWLEGVTNETVIHFVHDEMGGYDAETWMRSGREIAGCYARGEYPLKAMTTLEPSVPILHIYSQPGDAGYLAAQQDFAKDHPWYQVHQLAAHSHFPTLEVADEIAATIEGFVKDA